MSVPIKSNQLRACLNNLDQLLSRGSVHSNLRPMAAKVFVGDDAVQGSRS